MENNFSILAGNDIIDKMIQQAVDIDKIVYSDMLGVYDICISWYNKNPYIYVMLFDSVVNRIVGYANLMPLCEETYSLVLQGELSDTNISANDIETYNNNQSYLLYIASIAIHPDYHNTSAFRILLNGINKHLQKIYDKGITFNSICAIAETDMGKRLCEHFNMAYTGNQIHGLKIYRSISSLS